MLDLSETYSELLFTTAANSAHAAIQVKAGKLRKLGRGLYTANLIDPLEKIIRRNAWEIVAHYFPDALIADRTALEGKVADDGSVFVISSRQTEVRLPGLRIRPRSGPAPLRSDRKLMKVRICSPARAILDNMAPSRKRRGLVARTLSAEELSQWLTRHLRVHKADGLEDLKLSALDLAPQLNQTNAAERLREAMGALLAGGPIVSESTAVNATRSAANFDASRVELFEQLRALLNLECPVGVRPRDLHCEALLPFFEGFFSTCIDGVEFHPDDAVAVAIHKQMPPNRQTEANDLLAAVSVASDWRYEEPMADDFAEFITKMENLHSRLLGHRREATPGKFKESAGTVKASTFVAPEKVVGTLAKGFEMLQTLSPGLPRAIFAMFLTLEVRPFDTGNGRVARALMNEELAAAGKSPIIIPTIYSAEYLKGLRELSRGRGPSRLLQVMEFAQRYTAAINFSNYENAKGSLAETNAFLDPVRAIEEGIQLRLPGAQPL